MLTQEKLSDTYCLKKKPHLNQLSMESYKTLERTFSVEMKSKRFVWYLSMSNESQNRVLFEGSLGKLEKLTLIEGAVLEIKGRNGVIRIDLNEYELQKRFSKKRENRL